VRFLNGVSRCMARNQVDRRSRLDSKWVPAVTDHWRRQAEHCHCSRLARQKSRCTAQPQSAQMTPVGQRDWMSAASQSISAS
jgi:hypothetical protein